MCEHLQSLRDPRHLRAASVQFSQASLSVFSSALRAGAARVGSVLRAGAVQVVSLAVGRCTAEADAGSVWSCADADAAISSVSSSSERVMPHTDEHRC